MSELRCTFSYVIGLPGFSNLLKYLKTNYHRNYVFLYYVGTTYIKYVSSAAPVYFLHNTYYHGRKRCFVFNVDKMLLCSHTTIETV